MLLQVQKFHGKSKLQFEWATRTGEFEWEVNNLVDFYFELQTILPDDETDSLVVRRLLGAVRRVMNTTQGWETPEWYAFLDRVKQERQQKAAEAAERKAADQRQRSQWAAAHYNWVHYGDYNPWR